MDPLEWKFVFAVVPRDDSFMQRDAEELFDHLVRWAESKRLGVGGAFDRGLRGYVYGFGLCATRDGQTIPYEVAAELWTSVHEHVASRGGAAGRLQRI